MGSHTILRSRRLAAGVALAGAMGVVISGCSSSSSTAPKSTSSGGSAKPATVKDPTSPVTITFQSWVATDPDLKKMAAEFHQLHPNITVKMANVSSDSAAQKLTTQIAGGNPPDIAYVDASDVSDFASRGALLNLDSYIAQSKVVKTSDIVPAFKSFNTYNGSFWGLPIDGESTGLFYRKDRFKAAGISAPPTTWDEFMADAKKLTDPAKKQYGYEVFAPEAAYYFYPWLYQAGGDLLSQDGKKIIFDDAAGKKAANFYVGLAKYSPPDYLNSNSYDGRTAFAQGNVAMYMAGSWLAGTLTSEFPKITDKWTTAPLPNGPAGCKTTIAGDSLIIPAATKNADAAWLWMEFLEQPKMLARWTYKSKTGTELPPLTSLLDSADLVKTKPVLKGFATLMKCGVSSTVAQPKFPEIEEQLNNELGKAFYGKETADQALANAADKGAQILAH